MRVRASVRGGKRTAIDVKCQLQVAQYLDWVNPRFERASFISKYACSLAHHGEKLKLPHRPSELERVRGNFACYGRKPKETPIKMPHIDSWQPSNEHVFAYNDESSALVRGAV